MTFETCLIQVLSTISAILVVGFSIQCVMLSESSLKRQRLRRELSISEDKRVVLELRECDLKSTVDALQKRLGEFREENSILADRLEIICDLSDSTKSIEEVVAAFNLKDKSQ